MRSQHGMEGQWQRDQTTSKPGCEYYENLLPWAAASFRFTHGAIIYDLCSCSPSIDKAAMQQDWTRVLIRQCQ